MIGTVIGGGMSGDIVKRSFLEIMNFVDSREVERDNPPFMGNQIPMKRGNVL